LSVLRLKLNRSSRACGMSKRRYVDSVSSCLPLCASLHRWGLDPPSTFTCLPSRLPCAPTHPQRYLIAGVSSALSSALMGQNMATRMAGLQPALIGVHTFICPCAGEEGASEVAAAAYQPVGAH
jgi:hypothetical protein